MQHNELQIGFSPCPNDTFILHAALHGITDNQGLKFTPHIADVEELNGLVMRRSIAISKLSFHAWLRVKEDYALLDSGAALGFGCGPLIISKEPLTDEQLTSARIAVPGKFTTANLLFTMRHPAALNKEFMIFSDIERAVLDGSCDAGVIIHENRFTYADKGLTAVEDLGNWWERESGLPIPLGAFAIKRSLGEEVREKASNALAASIRYAFMNRAASWKYIKEHAQEMRDDVVRQHIDTYVNDFSISLGEEGYRAVDELERRALDSGVLTQ